MNRIKKAAGRLVKKIIDKFVGAGLDQEMVRAEGEALAQYPRENKEIVRTMAAEGCVLLKNDGALPLDKSEEAAVFGRCQYDWFYVGYGSGGNVNAPYKVNLIEGLKNAGAAFNEQLAETYHKWITEPDNIADEGWWGHWPFSHPEMNIDPDTVKKAAETSKTAVCVIGRAAGEDRDNKLEKGSYFLTDADLKMLDIVTAMFEKTGVVLNIGGIIDMSWTSRYGEKLSAILIAWLGGMESGNAVCDVLYGDVNPCGKLPDTIGISYESYPSSSNFGGKKQTVYEEGVFAGYRYFDANPEKVLWRFGFGLSYTAFEIEPEGSPEFDENTGKITVKAKITNTGALAGKEVFRLYCRAPEGSIQKPIRVLAGFAKTRLLSPGESQVLEVNFDRKYISSFCDSSHSFILEPGQYVFEAQLDSPPSFKHMGEFTVESEMVIEKCLPACLPIVDLKSRIEKHLPAAIKYTGDKGIKLEDVSAGKASLDEFIAQLSPEELEALTRGHGMMDSGLGTPGNAGTIGGVIPSLQEKGVWTLTCADGPAGLRLKKYCTLMPCGTAIAAAWNVELTEKLHRMIGEEMDRLGIDMQLSPGMNIHRNPLCGRNFEYFSEDPVLSGKTAAAVIRGVQSAGKSSCPKHFACNNQEKKRNTCDSQLSQRALREIYLRNFEIAVKEASPLAIMTSYNKINGVWSHYNYDLATTILRSEWGFSGLVITDWWMRRSKSPEFPRIRDNAYRVRAGVDVLMPGNMDRISKKYRSDGTLLKTLGKPDGITLGEIQASARRTLELLLALKTKK